MRIDVHHHYENYDFDEFAEAFANFKGEIMSQIDALKDAVAGVDSSQTAGFKIIGDALTELASDVAGLNQKIADLSADSPDLQSQIDALQADSQKITDGTNAAAQAIRDAIPTPDAVPADGPTSEPTPEPVQ